MTVAGGGADGGEFGADDGTFGTDVHPVVELTPWTGPIPPDHPDANFLGEVATMSLANPMPTLQALADNVGVPVGAIARMVLARWVTDGSAALLAAGPQVLTRMRRIVAEVTEDAATAEDAAILAAKAAAFDRLAEQLGWLSHGLDNAATTYPTGGTD